MPTGIDIVVNGRTERRVVKGHSIINQEQDLMESSRMIKLTDMLLCSTPTVTGMMEVGITGRSMDKEPTSSQIPQNTREIGRMISRADEVSCIFPTMIDMRANSMMDRERGGEFTTTPQGISMKVNTVVTRGVVMVFF